MLFPKYFSSFCCLICTVCARAIDDYHLPSYLHSCQKTDPKFNRCMIENAEALLPEIINGNENMHIPNLNPLTIPQINIKQGNKQIGLNMGVRDVKIYGIDNMKTVELDLNMDEKYMKSRSVFQRLEILGRHKSVGNVMVIRVHGEGAFNITAENIDYSYETHFEYMKKNDGYDYAITKEPKIYINRIGRVIFNLENMLGDDKIDSAVNDLLNQNWKELSDDIFHEMRDELRDITKVIVDAILGNFPVRALVPDLD